MVYFSQNASSSFVIEKKTWLEETQGIDYTENYKEFTKENKSDENTNKDLSVDDSPLKKPFQYDWSSLKYIFYFFVIGIIVFLIIKVFLDLNKNPTIDIQKLNVDSIEEIEERIHEVDLEGLLNEALEKRRYDVALRLHFLIIIKLLSERKLITWAKEKTNWEYFNEVSNTPLKNNFQNIIFSFESIWYGEQNLSEKDYKKIEPSFISFKETLTSYE